MIVKRKKNKAILAVAIGSLIVGIIVIFLVFRWTTYSSIDCDKIKQDSAYWEKRGVEFNLAPEAIDKCY